MKYRWCTRSYALDKLILSWDLLVVHSFIVKVGTYGHLPTTCWNVGCLDLLQAPKVAWVHGCWGPVMSRWWFGSISLQSLALTLSLLHFLRWSPKPWRSSIIKMSQFSSELHNLLFSGLCPVVRFYVNYHLLLKNNSLQRTKSCTNHHSGLVYSLFCTSEINCTGTSFLCYSKV